MSACATCSASSVKLGMDLNDDDGRLASALCGGGAAVYMSVTKKILLKNSD